MRHQISDHSLTFVTNYVTFFPESRSVRDVSGCDPTYGASAVPAGGLANFPRAALGIMPPGISGRPWVPLDWDRQGWVTPI